MVSRYVRAGAASAALLTVLTGCAPASPPAGGISRSPTTTSASGTPFALYTHCGIHEARVQDIFFVADQTLDDGHGNPPEGWGNPYQAGTIIVVGPNAIFHDAAGHTVTFHERPGATSFLTACS